MIKQSTETVTLHDNPQLLVDRHFADEELSHDPNFPKAIFIPYTQRVQNVLSLLDNLEWHSGPIYLLPSKQSDIDLIATSLRANVQFLFPEKETSFRSFISSLKTSNHPFRNYDTCWDLPFKRNYALYFARLNGLDRIMLVDDDIRGMSRSKVSVGSDCLNRYAIAGCFVDDFPDTSVFGHLLKLNGKELHPFLSGSFLLIRPFDTKGFFPNIYDEDWFFMIPHIIDRTICSFGTISQLAHEPFEDKRKAEFQEFGDTIADGLIWLIETDQYSKRHQQLIWDDIIDDRRSTLQELYSNINDQRAIVIAESALALNRTITSEHCTQFVHDWEEDCASWQRFIQEID